MGGNWRISGCGICGITGGLSGKPGILDGPGLAVGEGGINHRGTGRCGHTATFGTFTDGRGGAEYGRGGRWEAAFGGSLGKGAVRGRTASFRNDIPGGDIMEATSRRNATCQC